VKSFSKPPQASSSPIQRPFVDLEGTEEAHKCKNFLSAHHFLNPLYYHLLDLSHHVGPHLKLVISFNSLNIHSISKIVLHIHKKVAPNQSATDGKCIKPNILGTSSIATFSMLQNLIMVLNFDHVKRPLDMLV
jgi:hypothetical protein